MAILCRFHYVSLLLMLVCSVGSKPPIDVNEFLFSGALEFTDLTHPFDNDTSCAPVGVQHFTFPKNKAGVHIEGIVYDDQEQCRNSYHGTQIDAPFYTDTPWSVGKIPFKNFITPLIVVDLNNYVAGNADFVLERRHMDYLFHGDMRRNFTVLFRFGWSQRFANKRDYLGDQHPLRHNYPGMSEDVAKWIAMDKNLVGVAVDTASVDPGSETRGLARKVFADRNIFILENINIQRDLQRNRCTIIIMPVKFEDGTSAPCRVTTICPKLLGHDL